MTIQNSLSNFYQVVKATHPTLAVRISDDVIVVALYALAEDKSTGQEAADRLRRQTEDLPETLLRLRENALTSLGYS